MSNYTEKQRQSVMPLLRLKGRLLQFLIVLVENTQVRSDGKVFGGHAISFSNISAETHLSERRIRSWTRQLETLGHIRLAPTRPGLWLWTIPEWKTEKFRQLKRLSVQLLGILERHNAG